MTNVFKYLFITFIFIVATVWVVTIATRQSANVTSTQEVQLALNSAQLGSIRESATNAVDKKALVANLVLEVIKAQKEQGKDIKIDYVFLDKNGKVTEVENQIESVQFKVSLLNDEKKVISSSTQRISLNKN
jgi:hypothetical protein